MVVFMKLSVCYYGNPILRKKTKKITNFNDDLKSLVNDMIETMLTEDGVGLAANQVGESLSLAIIDPYPAKGGLTRMILVNPEIDFLNEETDIEEEGCLSVPKIYGKVKRYKNIRVKAQDINGKKIEFDAYGFMARIIQHEVDHLNGSLFVDKVITKDKKRIENELKEKF